MFTIITNDSDGMPATTPAVITVRSIDPFKDCQTSVSLSLWQSKGEGSPVKESAIGY